MIDIHCHLLPNTDDGSKSFEESLELLKNAFLDGIREIIVTPHYDVESPFHITKENNMKKLNELKELAKDIDVSLYLGNEIYINKDILKDLDEDKIATMAGSKYILVEFPFLNYAEDYDDYLYDLKKAGYKIIIAHPERYEYVKKDIEFVSRWLNEGYLLQANATSFKHHSDTINALLEKRYISFIASDGHNLNRPIKLKTAYDHVLNEYGKEYADKLFDNNARLILNSVVE